MAGGDAGRLAILQDLRARGQLLLDLPGIRYVGFLEEMTALALEAGFDGLVVIADEIQQYLDPAIKGGSADPTAALFDIVQGMITRQGTLRCGLILSIPRVSLTVLNDRRGDLVQRLKAHGLGFDLLTVYGPGFATELWEHLTRAFDCQEEAARVLGPDTLDALGQIAARPELANGPRTVVSAFSALIGRHFAEGGEPATPFDLVDAFLSGAIAFDGSSTLQTVINRCLATPLVSERPERGRAIRLLAAFPTFGCKRGSTGTLRPAGDGRRACQRRAGAGGALPRRRHRSRGPAARNRDHPGGAGAAQRGRHRLADHHPEGLLAGLRGGRCAHLWACA